MQLPCFKIFVKTFLKILVHSFFLGETYKNKVVLSRFYQLTKIQYCFYLRIGSRNRSISWNTFLWFVKNLDPNCVNIIIFYESSARGIRQKPLLFLLVIASHTNPKTGVLPHPINLPY